MKNLFLHQWGIYLLLVICFTAFLPTAVTAVPTYQEDDPQAQADVLLDQGYSLIEEEKFREGIEKFESALPFFREAGDRGGEAFCLFSIGLVKHYLTQVVTLKLCV